MTTVEPPRSILAAGNGGESMKRIVLTFGLISGFIVAALMAITVPLCMNGHIGFDWSEVIGYSSMVLAFLMVFFGIRSYRDNVGGGSITFGKAFQVGILITLIACVVYVVTWEIVYFNFIPGFVDSYAVHTLQKLREHGASDAAIAVKVKEMARFKELYANPFINVGMTFMEIFPVGLIVTLVSAGILRRRTAPPMTPATA
jgi:hypothetical protein